MLLKAKVAERTTDNFRVLGLVGCFKLVLSKESTKNYYENLLRPTRLIHGLSVELLQSWLMNELPN